MISLNFTFETRKGSHLKDTIEMEEIKFEYFQKNRVFSEVYTKTPNIQKLSWKHWILVNDALDVRTK